MDKESKVKKRQNPDIVTLETFATWQDVKNVKNFEH